MSMLTLRGLATAAFLVSFLTLAAQAESCKPNWLVVSEGGNRSLSSKYILQGTVGQTTGTELKSISVIDRQGFWQDFFFCGDPNGDGLINISDAVLLVCFIFADCVLQPYGAGDANCDGVVNVSDVVYLISYIFADGPPPCAGCPC